MAFPSLGNHNVINNLTSVLENAVLPVIVLKITWDLGPDTVPELASSKIASDDHCLPQSFAFFLIKVKYRTYRYMTSG